MAKKYLFKNGKTENKSVPSLAFVLDKKKHGVNRSESSVRPVLKKWGDNYIEIQPMSSSAPFVYDIPADFGKHRTGPKLQKIAHVLVKIDIAGIRRLGRDILEEY